MADTYPKETSIPYVPTDEAIIYPHTDGEPMSVNDYHRQAIIWTLQALEAHYAKNPDVYVSGDIFLYYKEGDPHKFISPDVLVSFGINKKPRYSYKTWEEGKVPDFVMEFSSKGTYDKDLDEKMDIYASMEIQDYFLHDAEGLYLPDPIMGFTLKDGVYEPIPPDEHEGFHSSVLSLDFRLRDTEIGIFDPVANEWVKTLTEQEAERAENAEARAEQETIARENAETRAENAETRAEQETIARENAEAENALLREELERMKADR